MLVTLESNKSKALLKAHQIIYNEVSTKDSGPKTTLEQQKLSSKT